MHLSKYMRFDGVTEEKQLDYPIQRWMKLKEKLFNNDTITLMELAREEEMTPSKGILARLENLRIGRGNTYIFKNPKMMRSAT